MMELGARERIVRPEAAGRRRRAGVFASATAVWLIAAVVGGAAANWAEAGGTADTAETYAEAGGTAATGETHASARPAAAGPESGAPLRVAEAPAGVWRVRHAPGTAPLWADPPVLKAVHGRPGTNGKWNGWAVGERGAMARFDGTEWRAFRDFEPRQTAPFVYTFNDVFVQGSESVWVVGSYTGDRACEDCGVIFHYDGRRWTALDRLSYGVNGRMGGLNAIDMLETADGWFGWVVGDDADFDRFKAMTIRFTPEGKHTTEGGWKVWQSSNIARDFYDVRLVAAEDTWAVGEGGIEAWFNSKGSEEPAWRSPGVSGADNLYAVDMTGPLYGWSGGARGRMNEYNGHCHDDDLTTQCWFDNRAIPVYPPGSITPWNIAIYDFDLLSPTSGWLVGAASGRTSTIAYKEPTDRWTLVSVAGDPGKTMYALAMIDARHAFAVGDAGVILEYEDVSPEPSPTSTTGPTSTPTATLPATLTPTATATDHPGETPTVTTVAPTDASPSATDDPPVSATPSLTASPSATYLTGEPATLTPEATSTGQPTPSGTPTATARTGGRTVYLPKLSRRY